MSGAERSERLDQHLAAAGLAPSRTAAARLIREGRVLLAGRPARKPSAVVPEGAPVEVLGADGPEWVSRAGGKLDGALAAFPRVDPAGLRCLDAGASTGGFTQVLLERGAQRVVAVDVGHGQLHPSLRADPRVIVHEGVNVRHLEPEDIGGPASLTVADLSFISLTLVLEPLMRATQPGGDLVLMVKPQFEVGRARLDKHGVVRDEAARQAGIRTVLDAAAGLGLTVLGQADSALPGQDGNLEHFLHLRRPRQAPDPPAGSGPQPVPASGQR